MFPDPVRVAALCITLAGVETLHGISRTVWLAPWLGKALAVKLSVISGTLLAFLVCYAMVPDMGLKGAGEHLALGGVLATFMATFDVLLGRFVMRFKWPRIWQDFNPASGNYLSFGLLILVFVPALVGWLRGVW